MESNKKLYKYSSSPHIKNPHTTKWVMVNVCIALMPAIIMGIIFFGLSALLIVSLALASAVLSEYIFCLIIGKSTRQFLKEFDYTSCVTGLLVGMTIGTNYPWYAPVFGSIFAIIVVKMLFGGTGKNIVNPAICGRIFIFISFQSLATNWLLPGGTPVTGATPIVGILDPNETLSSLSVWDMLLGTNLAGCIGETCKIALLVGAIYLSVLKIIKIQFPLIFIGVTGLFQVALLGFDFSLFLPSILTGGLILGGFFMATDYVTTPNTNLGNYIYFIALGLLTAGLRVATKMEAVSFAILLMNLLVPLFDKYIIHKPFGNHKKNKKEDI